MRAERTARELELDSTRLADADAGARGAEHRDVAIGAPVGDRRDPAVRGDRGDPIAARVRPRAARAPHPPAAGARPAEQQRALHSHSQAHPQLSEPLRAPSTLCIQTLCSYTVH